jgi:hypothetical protein
MWPAWRLFTVILVFSVALDFYQEVQANNTVDALRAIGSR